jgi:hypothetical protein
MTNPSHRSSPVRYLPWLLGAIALLPLLICWHELRHLFWFGDEWDQLDFISTYGFWRWMWGCFGENFAPVFKATWGGIALASGGSYAKVLIALWLVHALCVGLLARWLLRTGVSGTATVAAVVVLALASTNIETLGWTIQLITLEGILFFIAAAQWHHARESNDAWTPAAVAVLAVLVIASTFSFVRGALAGGSLAITSLLLAAVAKARSGKWHIPVSVVLVCLVPAVTSVAVIMKFAPGNHQHLATVDWHAPAMFAASYYFLNPIYKFFTDAAWSNTTLAGFAAMKTAILVVGWWRATPSQRRLLLPLLVFDLGNAALMGLGRYNEPLFTATSSRYQYISLVCFLPFVAILFDWALSALATRQRLRLCCGAVIIVALGFGAARRWPIESPGWANGRGRQTRHVIFEEKNPPAEGAIPGIPFLRTERAKQITRQFDLH